MGLISLHRKYSFIDYQHHLCSFATLIKLIALIGAFVVPIIIILKLNSTESHFVTFEQPVVKFQYKYILIAENSIDNETGKNILCSSFDALNQFNESKKCSKIQISEKDLNYDGTIDELNFKFEFNTINNYGIKSVSVVLFLDARIGNQCEFRIPTAVILKKKLSENFYNRKISISGNLDVSQIQSVVCPFFLRNVKSHFFYEVLNENQTNLEEFRLSSIREHLEHNLMHFNFKETTTDYEQFSDEKTTIKVNVKIPELAIRYQKSFWQKLMSFWMQFLSIFIIAIAIENYILNYIFENRLIITRRKNYIKDKEF
ncbi:transmembrane protein 231 [Chironomus tepperi]|uniref:transmembrane protein 231 n=1 Tax=Chironomus tepperi TaxID=113505 RepID=UPI00391FA8F8